MRGQIRSLGKFPKPPEAVRKLIEKAGAEGALQWLVRRLARC
jgi:hypothetical protein